MKNFYNPSENSNFYFDQMVCDPSRRIGLFRLSDNSPFLTGILVDPEVSLSISNNWDSSGGIQVMDTIMNMVTSTAKSAAGQMLVGKLNSGDGLLGSIGNGLNSLVGKDMTGWIQKHQNYAYINPTKMIRQYNGTSTNFSIPDMLCLFMKTKSSDKSIKEKIADRSFLAHFMGTYVSDETLKLDGYDLLAVQAPPNGYTVDYTNILSEDDIPGTFHLHVGKSLLLRNVIVKDVQVKVSQQRVGKVNNPNDDLDSFEVVEDGDEPLYALMSISFEFAKEVTPDMICKIINRS